MDYEKLHKDTITKLQEMVNSGKITIETARGICADFVPESEDERIRKEIIAMLSNAEDYGLDKEFAKRAIAWLEKQVEQKPVDEVIEEEKPLLEKFKQAVYDCAWGKVTCKKEGETKEEYANRWAEQFLLMVRDWVDDYIDFTIQQKLRNSYEKGKTDIIEKLDEQKPVDKVEHKFKVGDWVILTAGELSITLQIVNVDINKKLYWFNDCSCLPIVDEEWLHLWTIQDAKDGDVLADNKNDVIIIFRKIGNAEWDDVIDYHCYYDNHRESFIVQEDVEFWGDTNDNQLKPATKEQRELLFSKMHEAGYKWDTEKKELKNRAQQHPQKWSEDDEKKELKKIDNEIEIPFSAKDSELQEATYYIPKGFHAEIDGDKVVIKKGEKPTAWSEEDDEMLEDVRSNFEYNKGVMTHALIEQYNHFFDKIKHLQSQPEHIWSEEDEKNLNILISNLVRIGASTRTDSTSVNYTFAREIDWLKSIKDRYTFS